MRRVKKQDFIPFLFDFFNEIFPTTGYNMFIFTEKLSGYAHGVYIYRFIVSGNGWLQSD